MPVVSSQKKIRDLERLKKKLGDSGDAEQIKSIDTEISKWKEKKEDNILHEKENRVKNKANRRQKNPNPTKKHSKPKIDERLATSSSSATVKKRKADNSGVAVDSNQSTGPNTKRTRSTSSQRNQRSLQETDDGNTYSDSFFIDPKDFNKSTGDSSATEFHHKKLKKGEQLHINVENIARYSANGKYFHNHSMAKNNKFMNSVDTSKMTKQELRLHNWQQKEREKRYNRSAGLFGGMAADQSRTSSAHGGGPGGGGRGRGNTNRAKPGSGSGRGDGRAGRGRSPHHNPVYGPGRRDPPVGETGSQPKLNRSAQSAGTNTSSQSGATWMQGGGVSARAVTEAVKSKQKGMIVAAQGKKIVFD